MGIFLLILLNAKEVDISVDETGVNITTTKSVKVNAIKLDNPPRIVVDLSRVKVKEKGIQELNGSGIIEKVRSAQFSINPDIYRVVIDLKKDATYELFSNNKTLKVALKPVETLASPSPKVASTGEILSQSPEVVKEEEKKPVDILKTLPTHKVTLDFENADIRDILKVLSELSGVNIIYGSDVTGTLSIRLENVPFNEAFNTILLMKGLVAVQVGSNILNVMTPEKYTESKSKLSVFLETEIYNVKYQKPSDLKSQLEAIFTAEGETVKINTNDANNQVIITAAPRILERVRKLIGELDTQPEQVLIEARLVEVRTDTLKELGVEWEAFKAFSISPNETGTLGTTATEGTTPKARILRAGADPTTGFGPTPPEALRAPGTGVFGVPQNLPMGVLTFAYWDTNLNMLDITLSILEQKGKVKVLASPKVTTMNNQKAKITLGQEVPFQVAQLGAGGAVAQTTQFKEVGIILEVMPRINADGKITLYLKPTSSFATQTQQGPVVSKREAETNVIIPNGETLVIGGLISETDTDAIKKVPLLGDIPVVGDLLFKTTLKRKEKTELLVFVSPKIVTN